MLMRVNEKILLIFNNIFLSEYLVQINQAIYSTNSNSIPDYQKIIKEKFLNILHLLRNISGTKLILDQLSDASLSRNNI